MDDNTWMYHLHRGDDSKWFRDIIRDPELADEAVRIEQESGLSPGDSRSRMRGIIDARYTVPA